MSKCVHIYTVHHCLDKSNQISKDIAFFLQIIVLFCFQVIYYFHWYVPYDYEICPQGLLLVNGKFCTSEKPLWHSRTRCVFTYHVFCVWVSVCMYVCVHSIDLSTNLHLLNSYKVQKKRAWGMQIGNNQPFSVSGAKTFLPKSGTRKSRLKDDTLFDIEPMTV